MAPSRRRVEYQCTGCCPLPVGQSLSETTLTVHAQPARPGSYTRYLNIQKATVDYWSMTACREYRVARVPLQEASSPTFSFRPQIRVVTSAFCSSKTDQISQTKTSGRCYAAHTFGASVSQSIFTNRAVSYDFQLGKRKKRKMKREGRGNGACFRRRLVG